MNPHGLQALRVAADLEQFDAWQQLPIAFMEDHPVFIDAPDQGDHVLHRVRMPQGLKAHAAAGGVVHLVVLHMETRLRQAVQIARVIVVQVGEHHMLHIFGLHAQGRKRRDRAMNQLAAALARRVRVEAGVDQHDAAGAAHQPHEEIHGHVAVVRISAQKVVAPLARHPGVSDGMDLVLGGDGWRHGAHFTLLGRPSARTDPPAGPRPCRCAPPRRVRKHTPDAPGAVPTERSALPARWQYRFRG
ncbi:hypothetical protein D3C87_1237970 [compost metagenome]